MWQMMAAGALMGALKSEQEKRAAKKDALLQAEIARYSPWSGMQASTRGKRSVNELGNVMQGALTGAEFAQQFGGGASGDALSADDFQKQIQVTSPYSTAPQAMPALAGPNPWAMMGQA